MPLPWPSHIRLSLRRLVNSCLVSVTRQCAILDGDPTLFCAMPCGAQLPRSVKNIYLFCGHTIDLVSKDM